jgi:hypothetical protein
MSKPILIPTIGDDPIVMFVGEEENNNNWRDHGYTRRHQGRIWAKTGYQSVRGNGRTIFIHPITKDEKDILQFEL